MESRYQARPASPNNRRGGRGLPAGGEGGAPGSAGKKPRGEDAAERGAGGGVGKGGLSEEFGARSDFAARAFTEKKVSNVDDLQYLNTVLIH